jgi:hypothetical protein
MTYEINHATAIVTEQKGSWRWQNAYRLATYAPHQCRDGHWVWQSISRSNKFACTRRTEAIFAAHRSGSLHNRPARFCTDDYGNLVFVA